jgi:hypothetical protein
MQTAQMGTEYSGGNSGANGGVDTDYLKKPDIAMLNTYYTDSDSVDQGIFAEMRSNVLLASGEHYAKKTSNFFRRLRDNKELNNEQKLRLTKNHIQKICKLYANNILSMNPGVGFTPKDENSMHDQKVAELHHSVWLDAVERYSIHEKMDDWCDSFVQIGEIAVKIFYDPSLGEMKGYEQEVDAEGNPYVDDMGEAIPDESKPIMAGEFVFEEIYGFNLLRPAECKDMKKAEWLGIRKMVDKMELKRRFQGNPELMQKIQSDMDETYQVFDATNGGYKKTNKQTMVREFYFRPSILFPQGYFYITTKAGILSEGELPGGLFPIVFAAFDKIQTTPRGRSPIKTMRPYQAEINRSASKIAEHQITLGDDKLIIQNGTKVSAGASLPGVRSINVTGKDPTILPGRDGSQYLNYMTGQITELYQVMMVAEDMAENSDGKLDPYILLFRSAKQKKKFQRYIARFEKFLIDVVKLYLTLAKLHLPDDAVIWAVGKNEQINIPEYRQLPDLCYEIKIEAQADDIETKLGKQIVMNHALQYIGPQLGKDDIGKILRQMPFSNMDASFDDLTIDYDTAVNDILALDRGEQPPINQYDNHVYMIKRLVARVKKPDFRFLPPPVQANYSQKIALHQQFEAKNQLAIQQAEQGMIPTSGYLVTCDFYVKDPTDATGVKTRRARVPYSSMEWLLKMLETQGTSQEGLQDMPGGAQAQLAAQFTRMGGSGPQPAAPPQPGSPRMDFPTGMPGTQPPAQPPAA